MPGVLQPNACRSHQGLTELHNLINILINFRDLDLAANATIPSVRNSTRPMFYHFVDGIPPFCVHVKVAFCVRRAYATFQLRRIFQR